MSDKDLPKDEKLEVQDSVEGNDSDDAVDDTPALNSVVDSSDVKEEDRPYVEGIGNNIEYGIADDVFSDGHVKEGKETPLNFLMNGSPEDAYDRLGTLNQGDIVGDEKHVKEYLSSVNDGWFVGGVSTPFLNPFYRSDSNWVNKVPYDNTYLGIGIPGIGKGKAAAKAVLRARAAAGLGTIRRVPLWASGIWLDIQAPSDGELYQLERQIARDKVDLGRAVAGINFSASSVRMTSALVNLALNNVVWSNVEGDTDITALKSMIKVIDVPQLIWGMIAAIYPDGYDVVRPCVHDPESCSELTKVRANIDRLSYTDRRMLSDEQLMFMHRKKLRRSVEDLERYWANHKIPLTRDIDVLGGKDDVMFRVSIPTIAEFEDAGNAWIDGIVNTIDRAFTQDVGTGERNAMIEKNAKLQELRRYGHWVTGVVYNSDGEEDEVVTDRSTIDTILDGYSSDLDIRDRVIKSVHNFIRDTTISAIGIPVYDCPACGGVCADENLNPSRPGLIQLEIQQIFFTLISGKLLALT